MFDAKNGTIITVYCQVLFLLIITLNNKRALPRAGGKICKINFLLLEIPT